MFLTIRFVLIFLISFTPFMIARSVYQDQLLREYTRAVVTARSTNMVHYEFSVHGEVYTGYYVKLHSLKWQGDVIMIRYYKDNPGMHKVVTED